MPLPSDRRVAVIGGGISGIAAANVLATTGFDPVVFEKSASVGGVWALAYPNVRLQNIHTQYRLADMPWPFIPDLHPTGAQIMRYLREAVQHFQIDVRLGHDVIALEEREGGWRLRHRSEHGVRDDQFGHVVVAVGQYTDGKKRPQVAGESQFDGPVLTERDVHSLDVFDGRRVAVVGFGKSAVDMATLAASRASHVTQVFRTARWLVPEHILGVHFTWALFNRVNSAMMPSWAHPTAAERLLHHRFRFVVHGFWRTIESVLRRQIRAHAAGAPRGAAERLASVIPGHALVPDLRSAAAMAPEGYYAHVAAGRIGPVRGELVSLQSHAIVLADGRTIPADIVVLCVGSETPTFPFLPERYRRLLEAERDGAQLYRHLVHPRIPRMGFAGFNHGFMHVPAVEVGTLWLASLFRGELALPAAERMEESIERVRAWKRGHIHFEPSRSCAINTRFQQYIDILLRDLGLSPYRKLPNVPAELFARYDAGDYGGVVDEYMRRSAKRRQPRVPIAVHT